VLEVAGEDDGGIDSRSLGGASESDGGGSEAQPASANTHAGRMTASSMKAMAPDRRRLRDLGIAGLTSRDGDAFRTVRVSRRDRALNREG
jgi:hypothetical protein